MTDEEKGRWESRQIAHLRKELAAMDVAALRSYLEALGAQVIFLASAIGETDWPEGFHLADVVEKRIRRAVLTSEGWQPITGT